LSDIKGVDVLDPDGEKVGTVADVFALPAFGHSNVDSDPAGKGRILKVERGGIMRTDAVDLYIPVKDVRYVATGQCLTIDCSNDVHNIPYAEKPDFMSVMCRADDDFPLGT
jgi:hypothetical protein